MPDGSDSKENTVVVYGMNVLDGKVYSGKPRCVAIYGDDGRPKILHCRISGSVWGITKRGDPDFDDWCRRFDVEDI